MTLEDVREQLRQKQAEAAIITRNNQFIGQDVRNDENLIGALTGFNGSDGLLIVTLDRALLFVDGRYELQAAQQTDPAEVEVIYQKNTSVFVAASGWLRQHQPSNTTILYNSWCLSAANLERFQRMMPEARFIADTRPIPTPTAQVFNLPLKYSGSNFPEKLAAVGNFLKQHQKSACFCAAADSVSWLLNLRSDALPESPVLRAMALITADGQFRLFGENLQLPADCPFRFLPFSAIESEIAAFASEAWLMEFNKTPAQILNIMSKHHIVPADMNDPCQQLKSVKNKTELTGFKQAHLHDGIAVCRFLCWLDHNRKPISEWQIVEKLRSFRRQQPLFYGDSFATIAGSGANAAVIHYQPTPEHNSLLTKNSVLLLDSGAQYFNGTTDITRTIAIGRPAKEIIHNYTIVLKAHIALASLTFPDNVAGTKMDAVCRSVMWRYRMDYAHGTGHGVGHFLNVHENPNNFSWYGSPQPLQAGNVTSIEPGYYKAGCYGIRIENLMYVTPIKNSDMMKFEFLTLVPLDKRLIDKYLLTGEERAWINRYHQTVYRKISPHLDNREKQWLQKACSPL